MLGYSAKRGGDKGRVFNLYKFKTMADERDEFGNLLPDEQRLTSNDRVGASQWS